MLKQEGTTKEYTYDSLNRLSTTKLTVNGTPQTITYSYDDVGNLATKTDGRNITTAYNYDEFNRLKSVVNAKLEATSYTYDLNGNLLTQTDGNRNVTTYEYNARNIVKKKISHEGRLCLPNSFTYINGKVESYTYNADGNMNTKIDRNGKTTAYVYDIHGRLMSRNTGSQTIAYTYDNNSNQLTMTDSTGTTTRTYDELNRTTTKNVPSIGMNTYVYDITTNVTAGNIKETSTDAKGNNVEKVYDKIGRLASVISADGTTTYTYDSNGNRISMEYPNGVKEEYTYYEDNLLKALVNKKADGSIIDSYSYTYDAAHNQTSKTDAKGTTSYTYDSLNRLEKVVEPDGKTTTYTFDKAGNRLTEAVAVAETVTAMTNYTYDEQNRLTTTVTVGGNGVSEKLTYNYDDNGNMISKFKVKLNLAEPNLVGTFDIFKAGEKEDNSVSFYEYDELNQLVKTTEGNKKISYAYNGEGYRVQKSINGQVSNYLYEADKVVLETNGTGAQTARNVYGTNLVSRTADNDTAYYLYNGHADVVALLSTTGSTLASYYYDAFGNATEKTGTASNPYRYAGYRYDEETDVYYLNARYYDAKIARFMTEDTYTGQQNDPLSLNLYTYCHNEPMMYIDPTGHYNAYIETNGAGGNGANTKGVGSGNLTEGSKGDNVKLLQQKLKNEGYNITVDGVFGPKTEKAVKDFQIKNGLTPDGIVGYNTNKVLFAKEDNKKNQKNNDDKKKSNEFSQNQGTSQSASSVANIIVLPILGLDAITAPTPGIEGSPILKTAIGITLTAVAAMEANDKIGKTVYNYLVIDLSYGDLTDAEVEAISVKNAVIGMPDKHPWDKLPSGGSISFEPPVDKAGNPQVKKGPNSGVLDKYGREWVRDKTADKVGNGHWDVQLPNGDHLNVNGDDTKNPGEINHGKPNNGNKKK